MFILLRKLFSIVTVATIVLWVFFIVFQMSKLKNINTIEDIQNALNQYYLFLNGDINASLKDDFAFISDFNAKIDLNSYFTLFDMDADGIPELHLKTPNEYIILKLIEDQLVVWHEGAVYENLLDNGDILWVKDGATPTHREYKYLKMDFNGELLELVNFSVYDYTNQWAFDSQAEYVFEDTVVSREEWDNLTEPYVTVGSNNIEWREYTTENIKVWLKYHQMENGLFYSSSLNE